MFHGRRELFGIKEIRREKQKGIDGFLFSLFPNCPSRSKSHKNWKIRPVKTKAENTSPLVNNLIDN